jgi:hypothetical protein
MRQLNLTVRIPRSKILLDTGNGHGGTDTKIRRFSNSSTIGAAMTYADNSTNGTTITLNEGGVYYITYTDFSSIGTHWYGMSANSAELTTSIETIVLTALIAKCSMSVNIRGNVSGVYIGNSGDVIRPHTDGTQNGTSIRDVFIITKIGDLYR